MTNVQFDLFSCDKIATNTGKSFASKLCTFLINPQW